MQALSSLRAFVEDRPWAAAATIAFCFAEVRLILLFFYQTDLGPDEAQYWFWGQTLDWGYYSKPPMIAWVIALPTTLFGDHVWAVRLLSPLLISATGLTLFAVSRRLYGDGPSIWTLILWLTLPVVFLGSTIISTDIPLLFFWSLSLLALVNLIDAKGTPPAMWWGALLGTAIGFGMLSKYAMIYFVLGTGLALIFSSYARRVLQIGPLLVAGLMVALIFGPNILWNAANGFQTLSHTADNANWGAELLNPDELLEFFGAQFGVIGPLLFGALIAGVVTFGKRMEQAGQLASRDVMLLCFILPPVIIISGQALISRAHANWAVAAYPAAMVLLPVWLMRWRARWVLWGSVGLHSALGLLFTILTLNFLVADRLGMSNEVKRLRGWEQTTSQLRAAAEGLDGVIVDEREIAAHLVWETRNDPITLYVADLNGHADNTYEYQFPLPDWPEGAYLLATQRSALICLYDDFRTIVPSGQSFVDLHAERRGVPERTIDLYRVSDYQPREATTCP